MPVVVDGRRLQTVEDLIASGPAAWDRSLNGARSEELVTVAEADLRAPLARPSKIVCIGLNYYDHAREANLELPRSPLIFAKFPSSLCGPGDEITWPEGLTEQVDWEAELAVVVGLPLRHADPETAMGGVFGYTAANDLSARDVQFSDGQWTRGKSLDGFCPVGPVVVTADEYGDPGRRSVRARVNGTLMQDSSTAEMIWGVGEILSFISASTSLMPGDLVLTGTPAGVGAFRAPPTFLQPGDEVEVEVEGIGVLKNPVAGPVAPQVEAIEPAAREVPPAS